MIHRRWCFKQHSRIFKELQLELPTANFQWKEAKNGHQVSDSHWSRISKCSQFVTLRLYLREVCKCLHFATGVQFPQTCLQPICDAATPPAPQSQDLICHSCNQPPPPSPILELFLFKNCVR